MNITILNPALFNQKVIEINAMIDAQTPVDPRMARVGKAIAPIIALSVMQPLAAAGLLGALSSFNLKERVYAAEVMTDEFWNSVIAQCDTARAALEQNVCISTDYTTYAVMSIVALRAALESGIDIRRDNFADMIDDEFLPAFEEEANRIAAMLKS